MLNFDAFELVEELPPGRYAYDMVWVDEWRGDRVRSRLCVRQFKAEGLRDDLFARTPDTFLIKNLLAKAASCKDFGLLVVDISVAFMHARTDEDTYVKVLYRYQEFKILANQCSSEWNEESIKALARVLMRQARDKYAFFNRMTSIRAFTMRFCHNLDLEQHGGDFLVCGLTSNLELLADEFKNHILVKKAEIVSLRPERQKETHFLKRRICVDDFVWHVVLGHRYVKSLLDAIAMNHGKSMATLGPKGQESSHVETEKLDLQEHREFRSGAGICQYMTEQRFDIVVRRKS